MAWTWGEDSTGARDGPSFLLLQTLHDVHSMNGACSIRSNRVIVAGTGMPVLEMVRVSSALNVDDSRAVAVARYGLLIAAVAVARVACAVHGVDATGEVSCSRVVAIDHAACACAATLRSRASHGYASMRIVWRCSVDPPRVDSVTLASSDIVTERK